MKKIFVQFLILFSLCFTLFPNEAVTTIPTDNITEYVQPASSSPNNLKDPR